MQGCARGRAPVCSRSMRMTLVSIGLMLAGCGGGEKTSATEATSGATESGGASETGVTGGVSSGTHGSSGGASSSGGETTAGPPEGQCRTQADCQDAGSCAPPGSVACGGATGCNLNGEPCEADATCGGTPDAPQFCAQDPCCGMGVCQPGCLDDLECGLARSCAADGRCVAAACDEQAPCPDNFACMAGSCARKPCDGDAACAGVCVLQQCQESFGTCELPAP